MPDSLRYFPVRSADDQLDVARILHDGLAEVGNRCLLAYEGQEVGVAELRARVASIQRQLARRGLKARQRVAVMLTNSVDHIALIYALILFGAVWIPVNVRLRGAGLSYVIDHSRPDLLIFDAEFATATEKKLCDFDRLVFSNKKGQHERF